MIVNNHYPFFIKWGGGETVLIHNEEELKSFLLNHGGNGVVSEDFTANGVSSVTPIAPFGDSISEATIQLNGKRLISKSDATLYNGTLFHIDSNKSLTLLNDANGVASILIDNITTSDANNTSIIDVHGGTLTLGNGVFLEGSLKESSATTKYGAQLHVAQGVISFAPHGTVEDGTIVINAHYDGGTINLNGCALHSRNTITTSNFDTLSYRSSDYEVSYGAIDIIIDGSLVDAEGFSVYLERVTEDINITIKNSSTVISRSSSYSSIYLRKCTGKITITVDESSHVIFVPTGGTAASTGYGIFMDGCTNSGNTITTGGRAGGTLTESKISETEISKVTVVDGYSQKGSNTKSTDTFTSVTYDNNQRIVTTTVITYTYTHYSGLIERTYYFDTTTTVTETVYGLSYTASTTKGLRTANGTVVKLNGSSVRTGTNHPF